MLGDAISASSAQAKQRSVLVIDDDLPYAHALARHLSVAGLKTSVAIGGADGIAAVQAQRPQIAVVDLRMHPMDGWAVIEALEALPERPQVVLLSAYLDVQTTVRAMRAGVADVVEKLVPPNELSARIHALELAVQERRSPDASSDPGQERDDAAALILGRTEAIGLVRRQIRSVAGYHDLSVLVFGETGTGKELVAAAVHELGTPGAPFVTVNCAAIPEHLFESELFGHEAGAFTDARTARAGLLETAGEGTLFLDEVGEMPPSLQPKLLRALETRTFRRIGSRRDLPFRARIVSATNAGSGPQSSLRPDLYYRLAGFAIVTPPLRERLADVAVLAPHFCERFCERYPGTKRRLDDAALRELESHSWPGNVRELRGVVEYAAVSVTGSRIGADAIHAALEERKAIDLGGAPGESSTFLVRPPPASGLRDVERNLILEAYENNAGNMSRTARQLGIPRSTLRDKLRRYGAI